MLAWIKDYLYYKIYSGPARNAPHDGINIKKYIEEKPPDVKLISQQELLEAKNKLKSPLDKPKTTFFCITPKDLLQAKCQLNNIKINDTIKHNNQLSPLLQEFNMVFKMGYKEFFEQQKLGKI